jgi:hypothetical protein
MKLKEHPLYSLLPGEVLLKRGQPLKCMAKAHPMYYYQNQERTLTDRIRVHATSPAPQPQLSFRPAEAITIGTSRAYGYFFHRYHLSSALYTIHLLTCTCAGLSRGIPQRGAAYRRRSYGMHTWVVWEGGKGNREFVCYVGLFS